MSQMTLHQIAVPLFNKFFNALAANLDKAADHCKEKGIAPAELIDMRLAPDMHPLGQQVRRASAHVCGLMANLSGVEAPSFADDEASFGDLKTRIAKTLEFVNSIKPDQIDGKAELVSDIVMPLRTFTLTGRDYLFHLVMPNFFFHVTTAYDIMRHAGVELGKRDFHGNVPGITRRFVAFLRPALDVPHFLYSSPRRS